MIKGKPDTKYILSESLVDLLSNTPLHKITVQKITDNCDFKRQTFYLHFKDKYDLVNWTYQQRNDLIVNSNLYKRPWQEILCKLLEHHRSNEKLISAMMDYSGQNSLNEYLHIYTYDTYIRILRNQMNLNQADGDFIFSLKLYCNGSAQMTKDWIRKGMKESPQFMASGLVNSMNLDLKKYCP